MSDLISNCCGARPWLNNETLERCSECLEHCEFETEERNISKRFFLGTLASKLFVLHNVQERGLGSARRELMTMDLPIEDVNTVSQMLIQFCNNE